jgi:transcriptional regulator with XRE-family HTH domain
MEDFGHPNGIGQRIRAARRARGIKSTAELAALIPGGLMSGPVLRNIEAGVKTDLAISELLNIARALSIAPIYLLAPIREPTAMIDLPNLSSDFGNMMAFEFDAWLSGSSDKIYDWTTPEDEGERSQLRAMRELERLVTERDRITHLTAIAPNLESADTDAGLGNHVEDHQLRKAEILRQIERIRSYLEAAGWKVQRWH